MFVKKLVHLTFPQQLVRQPLVYNLIRQYDIMTNILKAQVNNETGWLEVLLQGEADKVQQGLSWLSKEGVIVEVISESEEK